MISTLFLLPAPAALLGWWEALVKTIVTEHTSFSYSVHTEDQIPWAPHNNGNVTNVRLESQSKIYPPFIQQCPEALAMQTAGFTRVSVFLHAPRMLLIAQLSQDESYLLLRGLSSLSLSSLHYELGSSSWVSSQSLGRQGSTSPREVMWVQGEPRECHFQG